MKNLILLALSVLSLTSCLKEEIAIKKHEKTNADSYITTLNVGSNYTNQLFYNLESKSIVLTANREAWDLAFETTKDGYRVLINNGRMGGLKLLNTTDFAAIKVYTGSDWSYDPASADLDSTFVGDWRGTQNIYLFDLGSDINGTTLGKYKFRMLAVSDSSYTMEYCKLNETTPQQVTITKESDYNFSLFSLKTGQQVTAINSPKTTNYDFVIRTYTHVYSDGMPYLVVGCMLNDKNTAAARILTADYDGVSYADAIQLTYSSKIDAIGFDWKTYDFDESSYSIAPGRVYIIKTQKNDYYKIRFLDFYDDLGVKGAVKIEIQKLVA
jgi:hypothetical protein